MSFLTLTFAICFGVFAGMWLFNALGPLFKLVLCIVAAAGVWFSGLFSAQCGEKMRPSKKPLILVSLAALFGLLFGVLVYSVNFDQGDEERNKLAQFNEAPKAVFVGESPVKPLPPPVKIAPPPPLELVAPAPLEPVVPKIKPIRPSVARVIYIDGRKGFIRHISVLWEGGEAFEDVDLRELPFASQLVPLPPRPHHKKR